MRWSSERGVRFLLLPRGIPIGAGWYAPTDMLNISPISNEMIWEFKSLVTSNWSRNLSGALIFAFHLCVCHSVCVCVSILLSLNQEIDSWKHKSQLELTKLTWISFQWEKLTLQLWHAVSVNINWSISLSRWTMSMTSPALPISRHRRWLSAEMISGATNHHRRVSSDASAAPLLFNFVSFSVNFPAIFRRNSSGID